MRLRATASSGVSGRGALSLAQQALAVLRKYGTDAHLWMPGVGYVNGVTASNWIDSAGTQAGAVDQPVGLVQPAGYSNTNLLSFSEAFDNAAWIKTSTTVTPNVVTAPNGTLTADKIVEVAATANHYISRNYTTSAGTYTFSIYAKAAGRSRIVLAATTDTFGSGFDLSAGTVVSQNYTANSGTGVITSVGDGWYRCATTWPSAGASNSMRVLVFNGANSYTGDGTSGIYAWGAELEVGSSATTYTPSMGITANQSTTASKPILRQTSGRYSWQFDGTDDGLSLSSAPFQVADPHTVVCGFRLNANNIFQALFNAGGSGVQSLIELDVNSTNFPRVLLRDSAGATSAVTGSSTLSTARDYVGSYTHASGSIALGIDGVSAGSGTLSTASAGAIAAGSIGFRIADSSTRLNGNLYPVIAIKGTVSTADRLTLEKFVGACSGVTI